jgi:hypothetical protein
MQKQVIQNTNAVQTHTPADEQLAIEIGAAIESLLFVSGRPLERAELRKLLAIDEATLLQGLRALEQHLEQQGRGIRLQLLGEQVQLVTAPGKRSLCGCSAWPAHDSQINYCRPGNAGCNFVSPARYSHSD